MPEKFNLSSNNFSDENEHEAEELSRLLDALNAGQQPEHDNPEMAELLAVAALVKAAGGPVCPPQPILDRTVERALAGLRDSKPKWLKTAPRKWLFSGALGTAAAIAVVAVLNLLPSWQRHVPMPTLPPPPAAVSRPSNISPPAPDAKKPPLLSPAAPAGGPKPTDAAPPKPTGAAPSAGQQSPASGGSPARAQQAQNPPALLAPAPPEAPQPPAATAASGNSPEAAKEPPLTAPGQTSQPPFLAQKKSPAAAKQFSILAEQGAKITDAAEPGQKGPEASAGAAKSAPPAITPLKIPGQTPDLVVMDQASGTLRQVYRKGTPQEIIIIQRLRPQDARAAQDKSLPPAPPVTKSSGSKPDDASKINVVQVTIGDQEVTIEGRQSKEELLKLAKSLTP